MCERTPLAELLLLPGNGARKLLLAVGVGDAVEMLALIPDNGARKLLDYCVGYPKLKVMMSTSVSFSSVWNQGLSNQEEKGVASEGVAFVAPQQRRQKTDWWQRRQKTAGSCCERCDVGNVEPAHNTKDTLPQLNSEVVNPTGFADHKGLNIWCGKQCLQ